MVEQVDGAPGYGCGDKAVKNVLNLQKGLHAGASEHERVSPQS
jgi:hypothetical protein